MSNWKVSKEQISIFTHPSADKLQLGKIGTYQVVVQKDVYKDGDLVVFAPEKSILSGSLKDEYVTYLVGPDKDRVKSIRLRNEISSGIIIPSHLIPNFEQLPIGEDISELLGITKYEPPIPQQLSGQVKSFDMPFVGQHDCEHANVYVNDLKDGERVVVSEKLHGSQNILAYNFADGETIISSKGLLKSGFTIEESDTNTYWIACKNDELVEKIKQSFTEGVVQIFGELIPIQKGYSYGQDKPTVRIFDIRHNGKSIPYDVVPDNFKPLWVPLVFDGIINLDKREIVLHTDEVTGQQITKTDYLLPKSIVDLCKGKELVSGKSLHIREGVVLRPYIDRYAKDGTKLRLKIINPAYLETGEEIN